MTETLPFIVVNISRTLIFKNFTLLLFHEEYRGGYFACGFNDLHLYSLNQFSRVSNELFWFRYSKCSFHC